MMLFRLTPSWWVERKAKQGRKRWLPTGAQEAATVKPVGLRTKRRPVVLLFPQLQSTQILALVVLWTVFAPLASSEEATLSDDTVTVRTEGAHRLLLPKDWPVEQKDGLLNPVPIEQYLSMKFSQVASRLEELIQRLDAMNQRLRSVEETQKVLQARLRTLEAQRQPEGR